MNTYVTPIKESNLHTDSDRLWASLMEMAKLGATPKGGVNRQALTDLERQGRDLFIQWCRAEGCTIRIDNIGNIFARREGSDVKDLSAEKRTVHRDDTTWAQRNAK